MFSCVMSQLKIYEEMPFEVFRSAVSLDDRSSDVLFLGVSSIIDIHSSTVIFITQFLYILIK